MAEVDLNMELRGMSNFKIFKPIPGFPLKGLKKKTIKHKLGYRPVIQLWVEKIGGRKQRCPYFYFLPGFISEFSFYFYHEPYSKKEFVFRYNIYKEQKPEFVEVRSV